MATLIQLRRDTAANWSSNNPILSSGEIGIATDLQQFKIGNSASSWNQLEYVNAIPSQYLSLSNASATYLTISNASSTYIPLSASNSFDLAGSASAAQTAAQSYSDSLAVNYDSAGSASAAQTAAQSYADTQISNLVDSAPSTLNTLNELAAALGDDANFATSTASAIGERLTIANASATYLRQDTASASYLPISASSSYLFADTASATYLRQDTASAEYLTKTDASNTYFPISSSGSLLTETEASAIYAPLASASLTGTPLAPTAASGTNTTQIATTAFVRTEVSALVDSAPSTLDTLNELAEALGDDPNFATTVTNSIATKLDAATASTLYLPLSGSVNWENINNKPDPVITLDGDLSGSVTLTDLTSGTLNATITANSVALGTDTTGDYVAGLTAGDGISITGSAGEGWSPTVAINSATASVTFANVTSKPTTLSGYGITDALPTSASSNYLFVETASATYLRQDAASATYATISSPSFTGTPSAPTAASSTNNTQIATTEFVRTAVSNLVDAAPSTLDTLNELAAALGDDANFSTTVTNSIATKLDAATASTLYLPISGSITFGNITSKPTTLSGYGITDALPVSASSNFAPLTVVINTQTSASYGLVAVDAGELIEMNSASANTVIIPLNSSVPFPIGTKIDLIQIGAGQTTASAVSGVTINSKEGNRKLTGRWSAASLIKRGTDEWTLIGDLSA